MCLIWGSANTVSVIDTATNAVVATVPVNNGPVSAAFDSANQRVYVAQCWNSDNVSVIDTALQHLSSRPSQRGDRNPHGIGFDSYQ